MRTDPSFSRADELALRWEDLQRQGRSVDVEDLCAGCPELAPEVARRVESLRAVGPAFGSTGPTLDRTETATPPVVGESAGPGRTSARSTAEFSDLRFHAEGGLGEVFLARHAELNRDVALKFLKPGRADVEGLRRFVREAEVTGRLEHPGIVPVYALARDDAGHPCYAMRFIRGETLGKAIAEFHAADPGRGPSEAALALRDLLGRFASVCRTIAYAHSRGTIHRDLKPNNVMLGPFGETLVVDWGLARPLGDEPVGEGPAVSAGEGAIAATDGVVGTPQYMSPEQAQGRHDVVGPASDVYSLGATLYVLLTGRHPFPGGQLGEVLDKVRRGAFPTPRQVHPAVPPALDAIVRKAMATRIDDRYADALDLARDVDRWLADEPVSAWPEPWPKRLSRWARRHQAAVAGGLAFLVTAVVALSMSTVMVGRQKAEADRQRLKAELINGFLVHQLLGQASPARNARDRQVTVEELLGRASDSIGPGFAGQPEAEATTREVIGVTYQALGNYARAEPHLRQALDLRRRALGPDHPDTLASLNDVAALLQEDGRLVEAERLYRECLDAKVRLLGPEHPDTLATMSNLALLRQALKKPAEAEPMVRKVLEVRRRTLGPDNPDTLRSMNLLGSMLQDLGRLDEAQSLDEAALEGRTRLLGAEAPETLAVLNNLASLLQARKRLDEAAAIYRRIIEASGRVQGSDHPFTLTAMNNLAEALAAGGGKDEAAKWHRAAYEGRLRALRPGHPDTIVSANALAYILWDLGRREEAVPLYREVIAARRLALGEGHLDTLGPMYNLSGVLLELGRAAEAEPLLRAALPRLRTLLEPDHPVVLRVASALGWALTEVGKAGEALPLLDEVIAARRKALPAGHWAIANAESLRGACLAQLGRLDEAGPLLLRSEAVLRADPGVPPSRLVDARRRIVAYYEARGDRDAAAEWRARLPGPAAGPGPTAR